jgi:hypothetical protein
MFFFSYYQMHVSSNHIHHLKISHNRHVKFSNIFASLLFFHTHSFALTFNNNHLSYNPVQPSTSYIFHFKFLHNIHKYISILSAPLLFFYNHYFILAFIITFSLSLTQSYYLFNCQYFMFTNQLQNFTQHSQIYFKSFCLFTFFTYSFI